MTAPPRVSGAGLRILHVVAPARFGGVERVVQSLAAGQAGAGHAVRVVAVIEPSAEPHPFVESVQASGVEVVALPVTARAYRKERRGIRTACREHRPDVLHTHGYRPDVIDAGVARRLDIATVTTAHGFTGGRWRNRLYERVQRRAFCGFDAVIAVSRALEEQLLRSGVPRTSLFRVANAWAPTEQLDRVAARGALGIRDDRFRVGWVGRLTPEKGPDLLIEAVARLGTDRIAVSVVGSGRERAALAARAAALGVGERITWHGAVDHAGRLFRAFDVYALTSRTEGIPIVLFEAMAAGTPIVATDVGGVGEVVTPGEAVVVAPDPAAIARAIERVHADAAGAAARCRAAEDRLAREFGLGEWIDAYDRVYRATKLGAGAS